MRGDVGKHQSREGTCFCPPGMRRRGGALGWSSAPPPAPQHIHSRSTLECAYRTHLVAGIGFYQHLLLYIQSHYQLELQCCIDWTHVTDPLIGQCAVRPSGLVELVAQPGAEPSSTTRRCW